MSDREAAPPNVTEAIRLRHADVEVEIMNLAGDASTRRYFRVAWPGGTEIVAQYPEPFAPETSPFLQVHAVLEELGIPVPAVLAVDGDRALIVTEDLGDETLQKALLAQPDEARGKLYDSLLARLGELHRDAAEWKGQAVCFDVAFDVEKLSWELHYFEKHFLEGERQRSLTTEDRSTLARSFHELAREMTSWPRVLCHRDFHSRNLMLHRDELYWLDFQDARLGPATYDLASLLRDSYVDIGEDFVAARAEEFHGRWLADLTRAEFSRRFELTCLQRNMKALGTFGYMASVKGRGFYLEYVPRTLEYVRTNLERHAALDAMRRVLARHLPELC